MFYEYVALSDKDIESLTIVINSLSYDRLYKGEVSPTAKELDMQVMQWLKRKFALNDNQSILSHANKQPIRTMNSADFQTNVNTSTIEKQKMRDDILAMFDKVDEWNFDVFALSELTEGNTLFVTAYTLFVKYDLLNKFKISESSLINFLREVRVVTFILLLGAKWVSCQSLSQ